MMKLSVTLLIAVCTTAATAQTALESVPSRNAEFGLGLNMGWYDHWADADLGRLAMGDDARDVEGVGATALRPALFAYFLERWGTDIREDEFELYSRLGSDQNVVIAGYPSDGQRGTEEWCAGRRSELFRGMWEDIWDNNNGTPVNEDNAYAAYMYAAVQTYGPHVRYWEVWNEPDISRSGNGWKPRGTAGNWFENDIDPCELKINAPIQAYVRMLRISYEVVKRLRPNDYVAIGGIGSPGFLDAVLRSTDEPQSGAVTSDYPLTGGAYFDALSFHTYPHVDGAFREWDNDAGDWAYTRNSDVAVAGFAEAREELNDVLSAYGFDGSRFPAKVEICTETNLPRRGFREETADESSPRMQRNYLIKLLARAQSWGMSQIHFYQLAEKERRGEADFEFETMGMYRYIDDADDFDEVTPTEAGVAYRTYAMLLRGAEYSAEATGALDLPAGIAGVGFETPFGKTAYVLWAENLTDGEPSATRSYALPTAVANLGLYAAGYDASVGGASDPVGATLTLDTDPVFLVEAEALSGSASPTLSTQSLEVQIAPNPATTQLNVELSVVEYPSEITVFDALGRAAMKVVPSSVSGRIGLDIAALTPGAYTLRVEGRGGVTSRAFVKE